MALPGCAFLQFHTDLQVFNAFQILARHPADKPFVSQPVCFLGLNNRREFISGGLTIEERLQPRNDIAGTMEICQGMLSCDASSTLPSTSLS